VLFGLAKPADGSLTTCFVTDRYPNGVGNGPGAATGTWPDGIVWTYPIDGEKIIDCQSFDPSVPQVEITFATNGKGSATMSIIKSPPWQGTCLLLDGVEITVCYSVQPVGGALEVEWGQIVVPANLVDPDAADEPYYPYYEQCTPAASLPVDPAGRGRRSGRRRRIGRIGRRVSPASAQPRRRRQRARDSDEMTDRNQSDDERIVAQWAPLTETPRTARAPRGHRPGAER